MMPIDLLAQDFVYTPINSSFGGNPYNYNWLLNSATEQNRIEDPNEENSKRQGFRAHATSGRAVADRICLSGLPP